MIVTYLVKEISYISLDGVLKKGQEKYINQDKKTVKNCGVYFAVTVHMLHILNPHALLLEKTWYQKATRQEYLLYSFTEKFYLATITSKKLVSDKQNYLKCYLFIYKIYIA